MLMYKFLLGFNAIFIEEWFAYDDICLYDVTCHVIIRKRINKLQEHVGTHFNSWHIYLVKEYRHTRYSKTMWPHLS